MISNVQQIWVYNQSVYLNILYHIHSISGTLNLKAVT